MFLWSESAESIDNMLCGNCVGLSNKYQGYMSTDHHWRVERMDYCYNTHLFERLTKALNIEWNEIVSNWKMVVLRFNRTNCYLEFSQEVGANRMIHSMFCMLLEEFFLCFRRIMEILTAQYIVRDKFKSQGILDIANKSTFCYCNSSWILALIEIYDKSETLEFSNISGY